MRLEFGNPDHIKIRNAISVEKIWNRLKNKIKCPHCGAKADHYFEVDIAKQYFGVNFRCNSSCINSVDGQEKAMERGEEPIDSYFNFDGTRYYF